MQPQSGASRSRLGAVPPGAEADPALLLFGGVLIGLPLTGAL